MKVFPTSSKVSSQKYQHNNKQQLKQKDEIDVDIGTIIENYPDSPPHTTDRYTSYTTNTNISPKKQNKVINRSNSFSDDSYLSEQHQQSSKISLKFKHSVSTNWIPSIRKKVSSSFDNDYNMKTSTDHDDISTPFSAASNLSNIPLPDVVITDSSSRRNTMPQSLISTQQTLKSGSISNNSSGIHTNRTINSKTSFFPKTSKRISLAPTSLIPKRFSSSHTSSSSPSSSSSNTIPPSTSSPTVMISLENQNIPSSPITVPSNFSNINTNSSTITGLNSPPMLSLSPDKTIISNNSTMHFQTSPSSGLQSAPYRQVLNRNTSFSSSITPSEKSTIGKSLNAFKRTTKSILFLESNSNESNSQLSSLDNDYQHILLNPIDNMTLIRRSKSYTESDRREALSFAMMEGSTEIERRNILSDSEDAIEYSPNIDVNNINDTFNGHILFDDASILKTNTLINNSRDRRQLDSSVNKNRHRSKTIDISDNPLLELTSGNNNTGLLSSIANFVKINKTPSSASSINKHNHSHQNLPKIDHLETVENETPADFLSRILKIYPITYIAELLSSEENDFLMQTLQQYISEYYDFSNEPLDLALRKFLMLNHLPKETQQIDRFIHQFAKYYHSQHPELGMDQDSIYILTYSLIMVHTDKFNPNNKKKMSRFEFVQNVLNALENNLTELTFNSNELPNLILKELLGYFFDNITYCPLTKISPEQSIFALDALKTKSLPLPYPNMSFLGSTSNNRNSDYDYRKSSISSGTSVPSSTVSIHRSNSQQILQAAPLRKKSSSFLWTSSASIDPYEYIVKNDNNILNDLKLLSHDKNVHLSCQNPFILPSEVDVQNSFVDEIPSIDMINKQLNNYSEQIEKDIEGELLSKIWKSLTKRQIDFTLKIPKSKGSYLVTDKVEALPLNESNGEEYYLVRVIKVGLIDRQEVKSTSSTTSQNESTAIPIMKPNLTDISAMEDNTTPTSSSSKNKNTVWKRYFCILTVVGMYFFKDVSTFRMRFCGKSDLDDTKMVIIEEASKSNLMNSSEDEFGISSNNVHSTINTLNLNTDSSSFMTFPYFRSDKNDKFDRVDKDKSQLIPSFVLDNESFATRKLQNIEYDNIVNEISNSPRIIPSQNEISSSNITLSSPFSLSSSSASNSQLASSMASQVFVSENSEHQYVNEEVKKSKLTNTKKTLNFTFFIYGKISKNIYMVSSLAELQSWIYSINIMNTLSGVKIDHEPIDYTIMPKEITTKKSSKDVMEPKYYELVPICSTSIEQRFLGRTSNELYDCVGENNNIYDLGTGECSEDSKSERRRNRSNTTLLSKITPSISNIGLGLTSISNKSESDRKSKVIKSDGNDVTSFSSNNEHEHSTTISRALSSDGSDNIDVSDNNKEVIDINKRSVNQLELVKELTETEFEKYTNTDTDPTRILSTNSSNISSLQHLQLLEHLYSMKRLLLTMPLQKKTKDDLLSTAKILSIKLEWLWFEKCRSRSIYVISKKIMNYTSTETDEK
ncbi:hypothetical protein C6P40_000586 [Pichia californica]|uniref:SEC7 domain-containing protein n=1 Tax=Pichia californica TaxID=460514 RepID=A0A9P7BG24_9ASCO|nr:hypothetical protein C6P40_000586 [[Candida] californica]